MPAEECKGACTHTAQPESTTKYLTPLALMQSALLGHIRA